jgi:hypothetical protein
MMHRLLLPLTAALALALAIPAPARAAMGGGGGGHSMGLGLGGGGHGSMGLGLGGGGGYGSMSLGLGGGHVSMGYGASRVPVGLGLTRGIGSPGSDDIHLGLSSRELGLGNDFGLDAPDNVLSRAARVGISPIIPGLGVRPGDRPSIQGLDLGMTQDAKPSSQHGKGSQANDDSTKGINFEKEERQERRSTSLEEQEQLLEQSQLENEVSASMPPSPSPTSPATTATATTNSPAAPTLPDVSPAVTTTLGSGEVSMIGAYFAQHGAPVASIPMSNVNVSVGGTVPDSVALFPPPYDLISQVSDPNFSYFVWGQNVVIVDGQTDVVSAIVPDVLAHQD